MPISSCKYLKNPNFMKTLKETSYDDSNNEYMTSSTIDVIDFDVVKTEYISKFNNVPEIKSNDALYISKKNEVFFIEFKNGKIGRHKLSILRKIYDSLLLLLDLLECDLNHIRKNVNYVLVYNAEKNKVTNTGSPRTKTTINQSPAFMSFVENNENLSKGNYDKFGIRKIFEKIFLNDIYILNENQFEKWLIEQES